MLQLKSNKRLKPGYYQVLFGKLSKNPISEGEAKEIERLGGKVAHVK